MESQGENESRAKRIEINWSGEEREEKGKEKLL